MIVQKLRKKNQRRLNVDLHCTHLVQKRFCSRSRVVHKTTKSQRTKNGTQIEPKQLHDQPVQREALLLSAKAREESAQQHAQRHVLAFRLGAVVAPHAQHRAETRLARRTTTTTTTTKRPRSSDFSYKTSRLHLRVLNRRHRRHLVEEVHVDTSFVVIKNVCILVLLFG